MHTQFFVVFVVVHTAIIVITMNHTIKTNPTTPVTKTEPGIPVEPWKCTEPGIPVEPW